MYGDDGLLLVLIDCYWTWPLKGKHKLYCKTEESSRMASDCCERYVLALERPCPSSKLARDNDRSSGQDTDR